MPATEYWTVREAAELAATTPRSIHRWIAEGRLPAYKFGKLTRIRKTDLDHFAERIPSAATRYADSSGGAS